MLTGILLNMTSLVLGYQLHCIAKICYSFEANLNSNNCMKTKDI